MLVSIPVPFMQSGEVELWCVRHGEATHNVDARQRGSAVAYLDPRHFNSELTPRGKAQARR